MKKKSPSVLEKRTTPTYLAPNNAALKQVRNVMRWLFFWDNEDVKSSESRTKFQLLQFNARAVLIGIID